MKEVRLREMSLLSQRFIYFDCIRSVAFDEPLDPKVIRFLAQYFLDNADLTIRGTKQIAALVDEFAARQGTTAKAAAKQVELFTGRTEGSVLKAHQRKGLKRQQLDKLRKQNNHQEGTVRAVGRHGLMFEPAPKKEDKTP